MRIRPKMPLLLKCCALSSAVLLSACGGGGIGPGRNDTADTDAGIIAIIDEGFGDGGRPLFDAADFDTADIDIDATSLADAETIDSWGQGDAQ